LTAPIDYPKEIYTSRKKKSNMQKSNIWDSVAIALLAVFLGFVAGFAGSVFNFFFVIAVVLILYDYSQRINELKNKLSDLESKFQK